MGKFLEIHELQKPTQEEVENLNRLTTGKEIEPLIQILPTKKRQRPDGFPGGFSQICKELLPFLLKLFQNV